MFQVSIIIATHSRPHLLSRAVKSALAAGTGVEVIVVDDASTDETAKVCKNLENIKYVRVERNQHTAGARNIGILNSSADYIGFLDDDDWRLPEVLDDQVRVLDENPQVGLVYAPYLLADQDGNVLDKPAIPAHCPQGDIFWEIIKSNPIGCLTAVFRKSCLSSVGLLDQTIPGTDDLDLWIRIAELYEFAAVEKPAAVWRMPTAESGQGSSNVVKLLSQAVKTFNEKWSKLPRAVREKENLEEASEQFINNMMKQMFHEAANTMHFKDSIKKFYQALYSQPKQLYKPRTHKVIARALINKSILRKTR